ncbi:MAG: radical SAM protein [Planctomycetota bacterium]|jgi:hypothetical protein
MLIRITNRCNQSCLHCGVDASGPDGAHMDRETFQAALALSTRLQVLVRLLSGGEPTLHPNFIDYVKAAKGLGGMVCIASNGYFLQNYQYTKAIYALCDKETHIQITTDKRYYREGPTLSPLPVPEQVMLIDKVETIFPCRRVRENNLTPTRQSPHCFNLRSAMRHMHEKGLPAAQAFAAGIMFLERQHARACTPSINVDGTVRAGEMDTCHGIGTVHDSLETLAGNLLDMNCNHCGLYEKLSNFHKAAVES